MLEFFKIRFYEVFHIFFRHFNFPCELGVRAIGNPNEYSPVFLSGNYTLTVHRLMKCLRPYDCYLIVANSKGSNVWCAAGMNEFNEFDIIDAINVSHLKGKVKGRRIIAPPYAAPGVDVKVIEEQTSFKLEWGPTHLDDLPDYIDKNYRRTSEMTLAQFGFLDRMEQALSTALVYCLTIFPLLFFFPTYTWILMGLIFVFHLTWFSFWNILPDENGWNKTLAHFAIAMAGLSCVAWYTSMSWENIVLWIVSLAAIVLLISLDGCGSSTIYKTTPKRWLREGNYQSHFGPIIDPDKCTNCYDCIYVCPKGVLARLPKGPAVSVRPDDCIECLACVKSCHDDAFYNTSQEWKGDVKSINDLENIMTRDWGHLVDELKWVGAPINYEKNMLVVDIKAINQLEFSNLKKDRIQQAKHLELGSGIETQ